MKAPIHYLHHPHSKVRCIDHLHSLILRIQIFRPVILLHMKIQCLCRQFRMQLPRFPIQPRPIIVKYPIRHIRRLLHFRQQYPAANDMYPSRRKIKHIPRLYRMLGQHLRDASILHPLLIFIRRNLLLKPRIQMSSFFGLNNT